jgi:hypothetical protein
MRQQVARELHPVMRDRDQHPPGAQSGSKPRQHLRQRHMVQRADAGNGVIRPGRQRNLADVAGHAGDVLRHCRLCGRDHVRRGIQRIHAISPLRQAGSERPRTAHPTSRTRPHERGNARSNRDWQYVLWSHARRLTAQSAIPQITVIGHHKLTTN